ncbi:MAG: ABC transporter permease [Longimicrobiaceae bacterium]
MTLHSVREGVGIALGSLRAHKVRAALTILGIVIGVATVMTVATLIAGLRTSITDQMESLGRNSFTVARFDLTQARIVGPGPRPWAGNPTISLDEAALVASLPSIRSVTPSVALSGEVRTGDRVVENVQGEADGADWPVYTLGDFTAGRNFLAAEVTRSEPLVVLSQPLARELFGVRDPIGQRVRLQGKRFEVVGVYLIKPNIFTALVENYLVIPYTSGIKHLNVDESWTQLLVVPRKGVPQEHAMDEVAAALRVARGLGAGQQNNFALIRQEAFVELFDRLTGVFFLVMLVLSSIGLMVGGVGVVAIMMISVTERTREIGVRKALGATRREILWQFLVESTTVTMVGAGLGLAAGGAAAVLIGTFTPIPASIPLWSLAAALGAAAISGVGFGLYPANKAARLDPVEALRYE